MNPIKEQVDLLLKIVPDAKTIGTVYCSSEVNSQIQIEIMKKAAAERGVNVMEATVSTVNDIQQAAQSLVGKVDVVYVPTDNVIASSMPTLVSVTDNAGLAVICGEEALVKGGGLATLGIDYYQLGKETGEMAAKILKGEANRQIWQYRLRSSLKPSLTKQAQSAWALLSRRMCCKTRKL